MEILLPLQFKPENLLSRNLQFMPSLFSKLKPQTISSSFSNLKPFCTAFSAPIPPLPLPPKVTVPSHGSSSRAVAAAEVAQLKENWLDSLTCPFLHLTEERSSSLGGADLSNGAGSNWIVGIDPDISGAVALLKSDESGCSAQVFDSPSLKVMVGKRIRKRLDAKSIVQLLHSFDAPVGMIVFSQAVIVIGEPFAESLDWVDFRALMCY